MIKQLTFKCGAYFLNCNSLESSHRVTYFCHSCESGNPKKKETGFRIKHAPYIDTGCGMTKIGI
ncbi:MAG: hypothetical protein A2042_00825 [Candidatus Schekmanbacteria bacterium GWA2_38_11]|uniref:Uncharacterized protein n=1 Tax=Candidatus Schekmanbacteria bacterium GWA2_38_11 TaxID=1817876 RepID=A0A1F7RAE1_9BACT|nr:MAG: hypothetical protein A2042_00825 [Candidatus Schekmanbacteria bacterium GWA2_38_11]